MATVPPPDEVWVDSRPMTDRREWRDSKRFRRIVTVSSFVPYGHVEGLSAWQEYTRGRWTAMDYPAARKTRILAHVFLHRFRRAEESS